MFRISLLVILFYSQSAFPISRFYSQWTGASEVKVYNKKIKIKKTPKRTWIKIIRLSSKKFSHCLFYKYNNENDYDIRVTDAIKDFDCKNFNEKIVYEEESLNDFDLISKDNSLNFFYGPKGVTSINLLIPLYNWNNSKLKLDSGDTFHKRTMEPGITIGKLESLNLSDGEVCESYNDKCEMIISKNCMDCKNGWYPVLNNNCPQYPKKYCGSQKCGKKNQMACIRGIEHTKNYKVFGVCEEGSEVAFCEPGLAYSCDSNGDLICL